MLIVRGPTRGLLPSLIVNSLEGILFDLYKHRGMTKKAESSQPISEAQNHTRGVFLGPLLGP